MNLADIVTQNRNGTARGLPSFCTANDYVIDALLAFAAHRNLPILIEATCNQVNQFGGYTGLKPIDFATKIRAKAKAVGLSEAQLILGGDHLGPNPWKSSPADEAMDKAKALVRDFVEADFTKIHLDASMACGGEPTPSFELVAARSAELCAVAENHAPDPNRLSYVIGTEVPVPGGETDDMSGIRPTPTGNLQATIDTHRAAFVAQGVPQGMDRAIAVVVQPGVDFSHADVFHYDRDAAADLTGAIGQYDGLCFEAHSTDYQTTDALSALVADHSVILKVGPELTFRLREALMSLDHIEAALNLANPACAINAVLAAMNAAPDDWTGYYQGTDAEVRMLQLFSYSDRIRYYWDQRVVATAVQALIDNLTGTGIPAALATQYGIGFPVRVEKVSPRDMIAERVATTAERYYTAGGWL